MILRDFRFSFVIPGGGDFIFEDMRDFINAEAKGEDTYLMPNGTQLILAEPTVSGKVVNGSWVTSSVDYGGVSNMFEGANSGWNWDQSNQALDIGGGIYGVLKNLVSSEDQWLGKNGKYYSNSWGGNQYTGSRSEAFQAANNYKWAGTATLGLSALSGSIETYNGYQKDKGQFGYNAQSAAFGTAGSLLGGWLGTEAGAWSFGIAGGLIGGPPGVVIGAVIGGFVGGLGGGYLGGDIGRGSVNYFHGR